MKYYKYTHYLYLAMAGLFLYNGIRSLNLGDRSPWPSFLFVALALFMFFFRRRNIQKLEENNKNKRE